MNTKFIQIANQHKTEFEYFLKNIFPVVMIWEGGGKYHNVPGDSGGNTIYGIAYNKNKQHFDSLEDHKNTTKEEAAAFAFVEYYLPLKPAFLPCKTKLYAFDIAYNMGVGRAKTFIQKAIGVTADGIFGPQTEKAMSKLTVEALHKMRVDFYHSIAKGSQAKFLNGWLNRAMDVYKRSL